MNDQNKALLEQLYKELCGQSEEHDGPLKNYIRRKINHKEDAEDIQSIVLEKMARASKVPTEPNYRKNWAYRIAKNAIVDWLRHEAVKNKHIVPLPDENQCGTADQHAPIQGHVNPGILVDHNTNPARVYEHQETSKAICRALQGLNSRDRFAIMGVCEGVPRKVLADKLCLSPSGFSNRIKAASERFRENLEREGLSLSGNIPEPALKTIIYMSEGVIHG